MTMQDERDLVLARVVDVSPELLFKAWTTPEHLMPWFWASPTRLERFTAPENTRRPTSGWASVRDGAGCWSNCSTMRSRRRWVEPMRAVLTGEASSKKKPRKTGAF